MAQHYRKIFVIVEVKIIGMKHYLKQVYFYILFI